MTTGLVIGKFYPPHKGHRFLIETAKSRVQNLTVMVCDKKGQKISGQLRAKWLREMFPNVNVMVIPDFLPDNDSPAWAGYVSWLLGKSPDIVFTSEDYGENFAKYLGCRHILVDKERKQIPVSATKVRESPLERWDYLSPSVRAYFAKRVVILGAESTGTTTLAKALAEHYKTSWVPEFGRVYWEGKINAPDASLWQSEEFVFIAKAQNKMEDVLAKACNKILFCDTNSFATSLWHERYMGKNSPEVLAVCAGRKYDLYILTDIDIPFVQDGTRDGEKIREKMHYRFLEELKKRKKKFIVASGNRNERLNRAIEVCDKVLGV
ncbi:AAA family ATPase [Candidatus Parcubacteria bacterium]|nr:AAA family ATPase [Candidatus Parcubacteria bacterium]